MKTLITFFALLLSVQLTAQEWKLIYENDKSGKAITGNIEALKEAVRTGKEIRIGWGFQHPSVKKISVEHVADAAFLTIQSDSIVHAQIRPIIGQSPNFDEGTIQLKENLEWVFIGGTNGKMDAMTRNTITGEIVDHKLRTNSFRWFVKD